MIKPNYLILSQILGSVVPSSCFLSHSEEAPDAGHDYEYEKRQTRKLAIASDRFKTI